MKVTKSLGLMLATLSVLTIAAAPASARHHRHQVCHKVWHHGHETRVCHWR